MTATGGRSRQNWAVQKRGRQREGPGGRPKERRKGVEERARGRGQMREWIKGKTGTVERKRLQRERTGCVLGWVSLRVLHE